VLASTEPTLSIANTGIGPNTIVELPEQPMASPVPLMSRLQLTDAINSGTIGLPTIGSGGPSNVEFDFTQYHSEVVNDGVINVASQQTATFWGASGVTNPAGEEDLFPGAMLGNNGEINVYGTLEAHHLTFGGTGTISLDAISQGLGLPAKPALFVNNPGLGGGPIEPTLTLAFNGGTLVTAGGSPIGTILDFASNPLNMIQLTDFTLSRYYMASGELNVLGTSGEGYSIDFKMLTPDIASNNAHFVVTRDGSLTDITWNAAAPVVGNYSPVEPIHPIPHPPPGPPGHVLI
jgi:hypothetical protein